MAKKSENFKSEEYIKLSETLLQNADILTGKLDSLRRDGESLKRTYESLFSMPKDDLDFLLETNSHFAELYKDLKKQLIEHNELINKFTDKISNVANLYGISNEQAKDSLSIAKEYFDIREKTENVNERIKDSLKKIKDNDDEILSLQQELINLGNNGFDRTSYYDEVGDKLDKAKEKADELNNELSRNKYVLSEINKTVNKINSTVNNNPIAKKLVSEIEHGNVELGTTMSLLNKVSESSEKVNKAKAKTIELGEKANEVTNVQNKKLTVALNILKGIWGLVKDGGNKWIEIDDKVSKVGRSIGLSTNQIRGYQKNILVNYSDMAAKLGMTTEEMMKFQENYTKNTGRAIILTNEQVSSLGAMSKLVGDVATNDMVKNMDDFGASTQTATSYLALNMARARSQGLDAQKASEAFSKNIKLASQYNFREGVNGISKMTLLSQKLKFNMDSIANAADKFETIEGAISTSANLQVLGGSFAAQFGNPLEAMNMAMLDMEGFTKKIVDTFSNKAIFNRETGQVEMSAIDKRYLKEATKNLGISYEEAWNMASQQAKIGDVERQINKTQNFSEEDKAWITSNSQYNAITKQHQVTFFENDEQKTVDVNYLTAEQLKEVKARAISDKAIQGDVHGIHSILKAYVEKEAGDTRSLKEIMTSAKEAKDVAIADWIDGPMKLFKELSGWFTSTLKNIGEILVLISGVLTIGKSIGSYLFGNSLNKLGKKAGINIIDGIGSLFGGKGKIASNGGGPTPPSGGHTPTPSRGGSGGGTSRTSFWGKAKNAFKGKKGKVGLAIGAATLIGGGLGLMSAADGSQVDHSKLGGREVGPNDVNPNEITPTNLEKTQELTELQKHTALLKVIAEKQGISTKNIIDNSSFDKTTIDNNSEQITASDVLSETMNTTLITSQLGSTKLAEKGLTAVAGKSGIKIATNMGKMVKSANPLGWISLGSSVLKDFSGVEEGSGVDKVWSTANSMLDGASIGAMIGSIVPGIGTAIGAGVGTLVGGAIGIIDNYGKDIVDFTSKTVDAVDGFLFGSDNMTESDKIQQQYEETKIGVVDIRDPQLEQKAQLATCQIHDVVVSMWHHMNGKQSNGLEKDKGLFGGIAKGLFGSEEKENINNSLKNNSLYNSVVYGDNGFVSRPNTYYNTKSFVDNISVKNNNNNNDIISKPTAGEYQYIRETNNYQQQSFNNGLVNNKLDLNVSGTIKLTSDRGNSVDIDLNKLLNTPSFINQLTTMISNEMNKRSNFGVGKDYNSVSHIMNGASSRSFLNATTNGAK